jgi:hypothetical protein
MTVKVAREDEFDKRPYRWPVLEPGLDPSFYTRPVAVAAIDDLPLGRRDRLQQAMLPDVCYEGLELAAPLRGKMSATGWNSISACSAFGCFTVSVGMIGHLG